MMDRTNLSISDLRELLKYDPHSGNLYWKARSEKWFASSGRGGARGACARWNARFADKPALARKEKGGCLSGCIFTRFYKSHRVIWAIMTGAWPSQEIDHIDRNPANNRWSNLRHVSHAENMKNRSVQRNNKSGVSGVRLVREGRWEAYIKSGGQKVHLGYCSSKDQAVRLRRSAEREYGFTAH